MKPWLPLAVALLASAGCASTPSSPVAASADLVPFTAAPYPLPDGYTMGDLADPLVHALAVGLHMEANPGPGDSGAKGLYAAILRGSGNTTLLSLAFESDRDPSASCADGSAILRSGGTVAFVTVVGPRDPAAEAAMQAVVASIRAATGAASACG